MVLLIVLVIDMQFTFYVECGMNTNCVIRMSIVGDFGLMVVVSSLTLLDFLISLVNI